MAKVDILHFLSRVPDASAADMAASLGVSLPAAGMTLLRLVRSGLACRTFDPDAQWYSYALTAKGRARLDFFEAQDATRSGREAVAPRSRPTSWTGAATMKRKKLHTGTYHCPACFIELELVAEESLKCDQCGGPLATGSLEEVWADDEEDEE
jgi:DNA-binding MarR family transcriptional regulator